MSAEAAYEEFHWSAELRSTAGQLRSRARTIALIAVLGGLVLSAVAIAFFGHRPMGRPHL